MADRVPFLHVLRGSWDNSHLTTYLTKLKNCVYFTFKKCQNFHLYH